MYFLHTNSAQRIQKNTYYVVTCLSWSSGSTITHQKISLRVMSIGIRFFVCVIHQIILRLGIIPCWSGRALSLSYACHNDYLEAQSLLTKAIIPCILSPCMFISTSTVYRLAIMCYIQIPIKSYLRDQFCCSLKTVQVQIVGEQG